jgi:hypothetical protein
MTWALIATGVGGAIMLALGCNLLVPLGEGLSILCDFIGVTSMMMFCGLLDGQ